MTKSRTICDRGEVGRHTSYASQTSNRYLFWGTLGVPKQSWASHLNYTTLASPNPLRYTAVILLLDIVATVEFV
jgi:hypothetical protein